MVARCGIAGLCLTTDLCQNNHVAVPAGVLRTNIEGLPAGVALGPGRIEVSFTSVPEALQQLFALAKAITNDYDRFAAIVGTHTNPQLALSA